MPKLNIAGAVAIVVAALVTLPALARAATITVSTLADPTGPSGTCTLRDAITAANTQTATNNCVAGTGTDTIQFGVTGTITLSSTPAIANALPGNLTIDGSGQAITLNGAKAYQIFNVNSGATLNLQFLTLADGSVTGADGGVGGGGALDNQGTPTSPTARSRPTRPRVATPRPRPRLAPPTMAAASVAEAPSTTKARRPSPTARSRATRPPEARPWT
jgi:CSLREA domain-containing protein